MGDSYISGEAGRWLGNSANVAADRDGTDRACVFVARAVHVLRRKPRLCRRQRGGQVSSLGRRRGRVRAAARRPAGQPRLRGGGHERPAARLRRRDPSPRRGAAGRSAATGRSGDARPHDHRLRSAATISGSPRSSPPASPRISRLRRRAARPRPRHCRTRSSRQATTKIAHAIDEIRAVMRAAGYADGGYRLVLQTYPVVIPRGAAARYPQPDPQRTVDGCPFYNADMDWANDVAAPRIGRAVKAAAAARGRRGARAPARVRGPRGLREDRRRGIRARAARRGRLGVGPRRQRDDDRDRRDPGALSPQRLRADGVRRCLAEMYASRAGRTPARAPPGRVRRRWC